MKLYESINNNLKESEDYDFDEIENMMASAEDYEDLYRAASYIKDDSLRIDVEQCIEQCETDGDEVDVAYSVTTSDYIDPYRNEENTPTMLADWRARNTRKESEETDDTYFLTYVVGDFTDSDKDAKEVAESLKKEYPDINVEYIPRVDKDGVWFIDIVGSEEEVGRFAKTWEPIKEYPDENGDYDITPYKEAEETEIKFKSNDPFHCPVCGATLDIPLGYNKVSDKYKYDDDGWFMIDWDCKECGASGSNIFTLQFWSQGVNTPKGFVEVANYGIEPDGAGLAEVNPHQLNKGE